MFVGGTPNLFGPHAVSCKDKPPNATSTFKVDSRPPRSCICHGTTREQAGPHHKPDHQSFSVTFEP